MLPSTSSPSPLSTPLATLTTLLQTLQSALPHSPPPPSNPHPPNALSLLHDSSSLLHAQTTKLSLLLLNRPFTPTAIASILTSISSGCVPGLLSVWELCDARLYSRVLRDEIRVLLRDTAAGLLALVGLIPQLEAQGGGRRGEEEEVEDERQREEILQATGQVWRVCDRMIAVAGMGIAGVAAEKVDAWHALVKDAVEEIESWDPENSEGSSFESDSSSPPTEKQNSTAAKASNTNNTLSKPSPPPPPHPIPNNNANPHALKPHILPPLKLLRMLYPALRKRRIAPFPPSSRTSLPSETQIKTLDELLSHLQAFSEETDEVAGALYDGDAQAVERRLAGLRVRAERCVDAVRLDWGGGEDAFSAWSGKWVGRMRETMGALGE